MVKRVVGKVDGKEVVLSWDKGDWWSVPVPFDQDGEYVVEILAEDEAGNQSYMAKMLFVVNTALLCAHMVPVPFYGELLAGNYSGDVCSLRYGLCLADPVFSASLFRPGYYAELIEPECGLCGRR